MYMWEEPNEIETEEPCVDLDKLVDQLIEHYGLRADSSDGGFGLDTDKTSH